MLISVFFCLFSLSLILSLILNPSLESCDAEARANTGEDLHGAHAVYTVIR